MNIHYGEVFFLKRNCNKKNNSVGIIFVAFGIGVVSVSIFPSKWIVVIYAIMLVVVGVMLINR